MKIYVASSWRNKEQQFVVKMLRLAGHDVYDFKNPREGDNGFHWSEIHADWKCWTPEVYRKSLDHPIANKAYKSDFDAMAWADLFVGVQPFGRSASLEMGWAAGHGKKTVLLLANGEPELMVKMLDYICLDIVDVICIIKKIEDQNKLTS